MPKAKPPAAKPSKSTSAVNTQKTPLKLRGKGRTLSSKTVFEGNVFTVTRDQVEEPGGVTARRDVIRHNGSVVILAVDTASNPGDPGIVLIRQWRHAADQFLLELPAGRIEPGEKLLPAGKRELLEETGYRARRWSRHVRYFASPGFLSEAMNVLLAENLTLGAATPEEDEKIELHLTPLSKVLTMIQEGKILDGKTIIAVLLYEEQRRKRGH
jgi:ADP-ribose pyrophosphatase